jgi:hypothetical protein
MRRRPSGRIVLPAGPARGDRCQPRHRPEGGLRAGRDLRDLRYRGRRHRARQRHRIRPRRRHLHQQHRHQPPGQPRNSGWHDMDELLGRAQRRLRRGRLQAERNRPAARPPGHHRFPGSQDSYATAASFRKGAPGSSRPSPVPNRSKLAIRPGTFPPSGVRQTRRPGFARLPSKSTSSTSPGESATAPDDVTYSARGTRGTDARSWPGPQAVAGSGSWPRLSSTSGRRPSIV